MNLPTQYLGGKTSYQIPQNLILNKNLNENDVDDDWRWWLQIFSEKKPQTNGEEIFFFFLGGGGDKEGFWEEILTSWIFSDL